MRVVIDANVLISFLLTGGETITKIIKSFRDGRFTLLVSDEILLEYKQVLDRFCQKGLIGVGDADSLFEEIIEGSLHVSGFSIVNISSDKKDNRYLECAKDGRADFLITGDKKHLLPIKKFGKTKNISPRGFVTNM